MMKKPPKPTPERQIDKFLLAARELETDESEEAFDEKLKRIAKATPPASKERKG